MLQRDPCLTRRGGYDGCLNCCCFQVDLVDFACSTCRFRVMDSIYEFCRIELFTVVDDVGLGLVLFWIAL